MSSELETLASYMSAYVSSHPNLSKSELVRATQLQFDLSKERSVYCDSYFSIRFSSASGKSFSYVVLSLSALQKYDNKPFIVCIVRQETIELLLANTTFLKKISHSSHRLRADNIRGSFLGHDIIRLYENIENVPRNFGVLFDIHSQFTWQENIDRLVEKTNAIVPIGVRFDPSIQQRDNILAAPIIASMLSQHPEYIQLGEELSRIVQGNLEAILKAGEIDNVNQRGNTIEQIITRSGNFHGVEDIVRTLNLGTEVRVDIKTKVLTLTSNPKGYNIDKILKTLSAENTIFSFFFVGINLDMQYVLTCLVSIFDQTILNAARVQFHWAGRNSRGVTQLTGDLSSLFRSNFTESIDINQAQDFLQRLISIPPFAE